MLLIGYKLWDVEPLGDVMIFMIPGAFLIILWFKAVTGQIRKEIAASYT